MTERRVSVLIPTIEINELTRRAVKSILEDGWPDIEVVLVVDGEAPITTPSWFPRSGQLLWTGRRSGAAVAINTGLRAASGAFIARLDADDLSYPGRFAQQIGVLDADPDCVVVASRADLIGVDDQRLGAFGSDYNRMNREGLTRTNAFIHSSIMMRKSDLIALGGYDANCIRMQDYDLLLRAAMKGRLTALDTALIGYRIHEDQTSKKLSGFGPLMRRITRQRRELAKLLGTSATRQYLADIAYISAQLARYLGLRAPRYLRQPGGRALR